MGNSNRGKGGQRLFLIAYSLPQKMFGSCAKCQCCSFFKGNRVFTYVSLMHLVIATINDLHHHHWVRVMHLVLCLLRVFVIPLHLIPTSAASMLFGWWLTSGWWFLHIPLSYLTFQYGIWALWFRYVYYFSPCSTQSHEKGLTVTGPITPYCTRVQ